MSSTCHYFIPAVREGLATQIKSDAAGHRAQLDVILTASARARDSGTWEPGTIHQAVELYGPGDVLGFDPRIVHRTDPKPDVADFEPDYFPAIEFTDPDFVWRYSAQAAGDGGRLQPWIALIVLVSEKRGDTIQPEFTEGKRAKPSLPRHILVDEQALPDLSEVWRWAHTHVTSGEGLDQAQLLELLRRQAELAVCRLLCTRRLQPSVRYTAFVVPTFKLGVMAGLGCALDPAVSATSLAWGDDGGVTSAECPLRDGEGRLRLPYYYRWDFRTGMRGDFEHLVRLLEPRTLTKLGTREMDCAKPGFGISGVQRPGLQDPASHYLDMEGALQSLDTRYTSWGRDLSAAIEDTGAIKDVRLNYVGATQDAESWHVTIAVSWLTTEAASSCVDYGLTGEYGGRVEDTQPKTTHMLSLAGLAPGSTYHLKITSRLSDGTVVETPDTGFLVPPDQTQRELANLLNKPNTEDRVPQDFSWDLEDTASITSVDLQVLPIGDQVRAKWHTEESCGSRVEFRRTDATSAEPRTVVGPDPRRDHDLLLDRLIPGKTYEFKIVTMTPTGDLLEAVKGSFTMPPLPAVIPPVYGRWHRGTLREIRSLVNPNNQEGRLETLNLLVNPDNQEGWLETLNLDPRHRAAAGLGSEVVRRNQEPLMAAAWDQLGAIESANDMLRRAQLGRDSSTFIHRRLAHLDADAFVRVTGAVQKHVTMSDEQANARTTVASYLRSQTRITAAPLDPAFSRIAGPRRMLAKRQKRMRPGVALRLGVLQRLAEGVLEAAGPTRQPLGPAGLAEISQRLLAEVEPPPAPPGAMPTVRRQTTGTPVALRPSLRFDDRVINATQLRDTIELRKPFATIRGILDIERTVTAVTGAVASWLDRQTVATKPPAQGAGFVGAIKEHVAAQLQPKSTFVERAKTRLRLVGKVAARFEDGATGDPLDPIMWAPEFDHPMYEPLRDIAHEMMLPGVERVPQNTIGLLCTNRRFIEAYLCGCNHEFAGELLWRGYPTDQRGSYFRQYWDVSEYVAREPELKAFLDSWLDTWGVSSVGDVPQLEKLRALVRSPGRTINTLTDMWIVGAGVSCVDELGDDQRHVLRELDDGNMQALTELNEEDLNNLTERVVKAERLAEKLRDIEPLTKWGENPLGTNKSPLADGLVLVIRGDLLRRYPNALVYAIAAAKDAQGESVPALTDYVSPEEAKPRVFPVFRADMPPDLTFFGFPFKATNARGNGGPGMYFVIEELPGEPRFGADTPVAVPPNLVNENWDDLSWAHFGFGAGEVDAHYGSYLPATPPDETLDKWSKDMKTAWKDATAAQRAQYTFQKPVRISIHATKMLPEESA